ncbi:MAG: energy transducer TonB, partial [Nitrospirae bacterium]|nr:energy transducer TonB [Nitrospirota bacterium]
MKFRNALVLSIILHIILLGIFFRYEIPQVKSSGLKQAPLIARIITPERVKKKPYRKVPEKRVSPPEVKKPRTRKKAVKKHLKKKKRSIQAKKKPSLLSKKRPGKLKKLKKPAEQAWKREKSVAQEVSRPEGMKKQKQSIEVRGGKKVPLIPPGRELLGRELIAKAMRKEAEKERKKKGSITFESKNLKYYSYMLKLKRRIESIWTYPEEAARRGIFGDLYIEFTIRKDGSLGAVRLLRTSGYPDLDEAAMRALKDGQPYWPLPEHWG